VAERSQYQYQPVTGPVWREPVAEKLAWLPRVQQPARGLPPNRLGDFVRPEFEALYKAERLEWWPEDSYRGRALSRAPNDWSIYPQQVAPAAYDPTDLEWTPQGRPPQNQFERRRLGDFAQPPYPALYDQSRLEWTVEDRYYGRSLPRARLDWTAFQHPIVGQVFDPQTLDWMPRGTAPRVPVELRRIGDFGQPAFEALYKPEGLQWLLTGQQPARTIRFIRTGFWVIDPRILLESGIIVPLYGWGARGRAGTLSAADPFGRIGTERAPDENMQVGTEASLDSSERIGTEQAKDENDRIGTAEAPDPEKRIGSEEE
jgi:hypothetical protein